MSEIVLLGAQVLRAWERFLTPFPRQVVEAIAAEYAGLMSQRIREVDPGDLRLPPSRSGGADAWKLHLQIKLFGSSTEGMPPILVYEDPEGVLEIVDGVTRAARLAKLALGERVPIIVIGRYRRNRSHSPAVRDRL